MVLLDQLVEKANLGEHFAVAFWVGSERILVTDENTRTHLVARLTGSSEEVTWRICPRKPEATDCPLLLWLAEKRTG